MAQHRHKTNAPTTSGGVLKKALKHIETSMIVGKPHLFVL